MPVAPLATADKKHRSDIVQHIQQLNAEAKECALSNPRQSLALAYKAYDLANEIGDKIGVFHSLHTQIKYYRATDNIARAWSVLDDATAVAKTLDKWEYTKHVLYAKATLLYKSGRLPEAHDAYKSLIRQAQKHRTSTSSALIGLAIIYADTGWYEQALSMLQQACDTAKRNNEMENLSTCYINIASVYNLTGHYKTSVSFLQQARNLKKSRNDDIGETLILTNLGITLSENLQQYDKALSYFEQAARLAERVEQHYTLARIHLYSGKVFAQLAQIEQAFQSVEKALVLAQAIQASDVVIDALYILGELHAKNGALEQALAVLGEALLMTTNGTQKPHLLMNIHLALAEIHEQTGDVANSVSHYKHYLELHNQHLNGEVRHKIAQLQLEYELRKTEESQQQQSKHIHALQLESERTKRELVETTLHLAHKHEALAKCRVGIERLAHNAKGQQKNTAHDLLSHIEQSLQSSDEWSHIEQQFQQVYNSFTQELSQRFPMLSPTEKKICCLLRLNLSSKDIADLLCISIHTLNTHRYHIRKKLAMKNNGNLVSLLTSF